MKYKVGIASTKPINVVTVSVNRINALSIKNGTNTKAVNTSEDHNIVLNALGNLSVKGKPCLFKNILPFVYVTLLNRVSNLGTTNIVANISRILSSISLIAVREQIPNQNIRFQKLSLFRRDLIKFMIKRMYKFQFVSTILEQYTTFRQVIRIIVLLFALIMPMSQCFAQDLVQLITKAEETYAIPKGLLSAIAHVESNFKPYTLNVSGKSITAHSHEEATKLVQMLLAKGHTNIDLGLMQINYHFHGRNFNNINQILNIRKNIQYAAWLLKIEYDKHKSWQTAIRHYHSKNARKHIKYSRKILLTWLKQ